MNLFSQLEAEPTHEEIFPGAVLMRGLALPQDAEFFAAIEAIMAAAPLHHAATPSGLPMGVMVTDCGNPRAFRRRWDRNNPNNPAVGGSGRPSRACCGLRRALRGAFGIPAFPPRRLPHQPLPGRHQARDCIRTATSRSDAAHRLHFAWIGVHIPARRLAAHRRTKRILLEHGDVIVWGGPSRMRFHGVQPLKPGHHPMTGPYRYNLTFRKIA